ncbi:MAG: hypothetical protein XXXJIFNMEKO3_LKCDNKCA_00098 (plasmid) [Candidatus Erwinia impunctatus]
MDGYTESQNRIGDACNRLVKTHGLINKTFRMRNVEYEVQQVVQSELMCLKLKGLG